MTFWTPTKIMIVTFAVVVGFSAVFSVVAFIGYVPLQFHCRRCDQPFRRAPWKRMPKQCPHCRARDWNV